MAVTPVALKDAIPLLETGGTTGRNNAKDIRLGLITPMFLPTGSEHVVRQGVLPRRWDGVSAFRSMKIYPSGTPDRNITFAGGASIITRTSEGAYLVYETADATILCDPANATNPCVEAAVVRLYDKNLAADTGAPLHGPYYDVIRGTPGAVINLNGTPGTAGAPPVIPDGVLLLSLNTRLAGAAGDTIGSAGNPIADKRKSAAVLGGIRQLLPGDLAADAGFLPGEFRTQMVSSVIKPPEFWGNDSLWHGTTPIPYNASLAASTALFLGDVTVMTLAIPDPGWPYKIQTTFDWHGLSGSPVTFTVQAQLDTFGGTNLTGVAAYPAGSAGSDGIGGPPAASDLHFSKSGLSAILTGAHSVLLTVDYLSGTGSTRSWNNGTSLTCLVIPV